MACGRKKKEILSLDEQIVQVGQTIERLEGELKKQKALRKDLQKQKDDQEILALKSAVEESGKSVDEVIIWLRNS